MTNWLVLALLTFTPVMDRGSIDCPDRDVLVKQLEAAGERQVARALKPEGIVVEWWVGENGNWTQIWTWPKGQSCVTAFGRYYASAGGRKT